MNTKALEIKGFDELIKALETMPDKAKPLVEEAMTKSVALLHDKHSGKSTRSNAYCEAQRGPQRGDDGLP